MTFISQTTRPGSTPDILVPDLDCDSSVAVGDWVRYDAFNILIKAQADSVDGAHVVGLVEEKTTSTKCVVRVAGVSKALFIGLDVSKEYFLSSVSAGQMTVSPPTASGEVLLSLGQPITPTKFIVRKGMRVKRS